MTRTVTFRDARESRRRKRCSRPPSPAACRSPPGSRSRTACGRPGGSQATSLEGPSATPPCSPSSCRRTAGIDIVTDGEQARQHFVHGFLEFVDGIDFARKVEIGIRADRYKAVVPQVTGELRLKGRVHAAEAQARARPYQAQAQVHPARPDDHRRHHRRRPLRRPGEDGDGVRRPPERRGARARRRRRRRDPVRRAGLQRLHGGGQGLGHRGAAPRDRGARLHHRGAHLLRLRHQGQHRLEGDARRRVAPVRGDLSGAGAEPHRPGLGRVPQFARADEPAGAPRRQGRSGRRDRCRDRRGGNARAGGGGDRRGHEVRAREKIIASTNCGMAPMRWDVAYGKLAALAQGAALARKRFG